MLRNILLALVAFAAILGLSRSAGAQSTPFFEITGAGSLYHFEAVSAGSKPFVSKLASTDFINCIKGITSECQGGVLETDTGGKAYIFLVSIRQAWLSTNTNCTNATELQGNVGGDGSFMFAAHHEASDTDV